MTRVDPSGAPSVSWRGSWICSGEDGDPAPLLRRELTVPTGVARGRLHVAGLGLHRTTVDGRPVSDARLESGLTAYDRRILYSTYDVPLGPGRSVIGVELGRGFYAMTTPNVWAWERAPWRGLRMALVQLELLDAEGQVVDTVVSDETWRWSAGPTRSDSYYAGETFDASLDPAGWDAPGFDDSAWAPVVPAQPPSRRLVPRQHEPIRVVDTAEPVTWLGGAGRPLVADLGRQLAGWARLTVPAEVPSGTEITLAFGEALDADGRVIAENEHVESDRLDLDRVIIGAGPFSWEPRFTYRGFRYVQVDGLDDPTMITLEARHAHNDVRPVSRFACSDEILNWIDAAMRLTVRNNLHHLPTDTPTFEKNGWTGDAQVSAEAMLGQFDLERLFTKWLDDLADAQLPDGGLPVIVPTPGWGSHVAAPEWTTVYPYLLDRVVAWYDRPDLADRHLAHVVRYLDHELSRVDADGLVTGRLGDYLVPGAPQGTPPHDDLRIAASCYLVRSLWATVELIIKTGWAGAAGVDEAKRLEAEGSNLAAAINAAFLDPAGGCYRSDREPRYRMTSNILPVAFGITPPDQIGMVVDRLVAEIHEHDDHHDCGCLGLSELFGVLSAHGHGDLAVRVATRTTPPSWGAWMRAGELTMREAWDVGFRSRNHYFMGAMARWLYADVAGVRMSAPGWSEFTVDPTTRGDLTHASYFYDGPRGTLGASWTLANGRCSTLVIVPPDTRARLRLPGRDPFWLETGRWEYVHPLT